MTLALFLARLAVPLHTVVLYVSNNKLKSSGANLTKIYNIQMPRLTLR